MSTALSTLSFPRLSNTPVLILRTTTTTGDGLADLPHDPLSAEVDGLDGPDAVVGAPAAVAPVTPPAHAASVPVPVPVVAHPAPPPVYRCVARPVAHRVAARAPRARWRW